jgi:hypothetical protein
MMDHKPWVRFAAALAALSFGTGPAGAGNSSAKPDNYQSSLGKLKPGDTLNLGSGTYRGGLPLQNLRGTAKSWITIQGPASGKPAVFEAVADQNTVQINNCCYVAVKNLTVDGKHLDGPDGIKASGSDSPPTHHILIEGCTVKDYNSGQQSVGISTKTPTWGWVIRNNRILNAGTGLYLGNSDGTCPFVAGIIEGNLVKDPIGYCMEIKWQKDRPKTEGLPAEASRTIVRHNVFIKNDGPSPSGDRPNLLVGGFPESGPGSSDLYEIYGNFFFHNPREALFQASGRVTVHDNVFVDVAGTAIVLQNHDRPLKFAQVYNNTVYAAGRGIAFSSQAREGSAAVGNLIFAGTGISGTPAVNKDNVVDAVANAGNHVKKPSKTLKDMDFYPLPGKCQVKALDLATFVKDTGYDTDFNGTSKGAFTFVGAYAGEGSNPGWALQDDLKNAAGPSAGKTKAPAKGPLKDKPASRTPAGR